MANVPGSYTKSTSRNPLARSQSSVCPMSACVPVASLRVWLSMSSRDATFSARASGYVTTMAGLCPSGACQRLRVSVRSICDGASGCPYLMSRLYPDGKIITASSPSMRDRSWYRYPASSSESPITSSGVLPQYFPGIRESSTAAAEPASPYMRGVTPCPIAVDNASCLGCVKNLSLRCCISIACPACLYFFFCGAESSFR